MIIGNGYYIKASRLPFIVILLLLCLISIVRTVFSIGLPIVFYIILSVIIGVVSEREEMLSFMCILLPLSGLFQYKVSLLVVSFFYLSKIRNPNFSRCIPVILMMIWEIMHAGQTHLTLYGFLREFAELIALGVVLCDSELRFTDEFSIRLFAYMSIFGSFINLFACIKLFGFSLSSISRLGNMSLEAEDFQGLLNPNTNGFICMLAIIGLVLIQKMGKEKFGDTAIILILTLFLLLTQSKAALAGVIIALGLFVFTGEIPRRITRNKMIVFIVIVIFAGIIGELILRDTVVALIKRFSSKDITTGRGVIFSFYHNHLMQTKRNFLFGIGLFRYTFQIRDIYGGLWQQYLGVATSLKDELIYKPCHMGVQEVIVVWGIIGILLFVFLLWIMLRHSGVKGEGFYYIPLIIVLLYSLQGEFVSSGGIMLSLLFVMVCMEYKNMGKI